jgi:hypothetical protein
MRFGFTHTLVASPKLNQVELIRAYWKQHELPNVYPTGYCQLSEAAAPYVACARAHDSSPPSDGRLFYGQYDLY